MKVRVLFFAGLREALGSKGREVELPSDATLGDLLRQLEQELPIVAEYASRLVIARNEQRCTLETVLADGDEIAFLPPMSGGVGDPG